MRAIDMIIEPTEEAWLTKSVETLQSVITSVINQKGRCLLGLSGGKTPTQLYERLGQRTDIDWSRVHLFLTDERYVPRTDPRSNLHLLDKTLLRYDQIDEVTQCTLPDTSLSLEKCVEQYNTDLEHMFADFGPTDLVALGIGDDGHIASLFPPLTSDALGPSLVMATHTGRFEVADRITMTIPPLHAAHRQLFLFKGEAKLKVWNEMLESKEDYTRWPMKAVMAFGETTVIVEK